MKRIATHKNLIALLIVIFAVVAMHTLQSIHRSTGKSMDEAGMPQHLLAR